MAAKIRLQRKGAKNKPFYRVVIQDESVARVGNVIDVLGVYDPRKEPAIFQVDEQKTKTWLTQGAAPTDKVRILLGKAGIMKPVDLAALPKRRPKKEASQEGKPALAETATDVAAKAGGAKGGETEPTPAGAKENKEEQK